MFLVKWSMSALCASEYSKTEADLTDVLENDRQDAARAPESVDSCDVNQVRHDREELQFSEDTLPVLFAVSLAWVDVVKAPERIHKIEYWWDFEEWWLDPIPSEVHSGGFQARPYL